MKACNSWQTHGNGLSVEPHAGTCLARIADHQGRIDGKHAGHRREVADIAVDDTEQRDDRRLVRRDAVDGVIAVAARKAQPGREAGEPVAAGAGT
jgi:hypothetical protein